MTCWVQAVHHPILSVYLKLGRLVVIEVLDGTPLPFSASWEIWDDYYGEASDGEYAEVAAPSKEEKADD